MSKEKSLSLRNLQEILSDLDSFAEDSLETIGQVMDNTPLKMLGVAKHIWNYHKERKMKRFLKGFSKKINEQGKKYDDKDRESLKEFLSHDHSREKFFGILDGALNSVSERSSEILGYFAGEILLSTQKIDYTSSIIIHALQNMNDWDIEYFNKAYNFLTSLPEDENAESVNSTMLFLRLRPEEYEQKGDELDKLILDNEELMEFRSSLMKLSNLQVINTGGLMIATDSNTFVRSNIGNKLNELINMFRID
ncbi:hypothetical protein SporoP37_13635 [Sporosarcina sp. P37]|uniref:hypothetical protein n=1 Tax=unclassified Sporosarcina TaxID=2647733 RepID=UPI000A17F7C4|nr:MULTISPECIES: hypothetical protein [unclassified Sporosarcina]ARK25592.1 hypothetical protein SporoP37_13635 [Sporosarcina sp. P37]PID17307.1 hypothetical protein CSV62_14280 [Sporosarcina sp. P35]